MDLMDEKYAKWDAQNYRGWNNRYPFTEVVSFVLRRFGGATERKEIRVLDMGCGGGHHLVFLAREGFDYYGIDGAAKGLAIAKERLAQNGFATDNLILGTFDQLPYESDFFDCVIDRGALVCNRKRDLDKPLEEVYRVMKPGAKLYSTIIEEQSSEKNTAEHLGDGDYTNFSGHLSGAGVLHFTNAAEIPELFHRFKVEDAILNVSRSVFPAAGNPEVSSWITVYCSK